MFNVIILSSGLSTRLRPITNQIPKCLVNVGQETALKRQVDYWIQYEDCNKIYVVIHPKYKDIVEAYINMHNLGKYKGMIEIINEPESNGSFEAIRNACYHVVDLNSNVFLNWSDIIPISKIKNTSYDTNIIFTNKSNHRFAINNNTIEYVGNGGNVPGLYYIKEMPNFLTYDIGDDLIEHMSEKDFKSIEIPKLVDFGDMQKLSSMTSDMVSRGFNSIKREGNKITKIALDDKGLDLQSKELGWYSLNPINTPKIYSKTKNSFTMERVDGAPVFEVYTQGLIRKSLKALQELHKTSSIEVDQETVKRDLKYEIVEKSYERKKSIQGIINGFGKVTRVNGIKLKSFDEIIMILYDRIEYFNSERNRYSFIHGDPNFSNTMYGKNKVWFIDPRGYFGKTKLYGPETYDYAKVLYAISGYDKFNADSNFGHYDLKNDNLNLSIPALEDFMEGETEVLFDQEIYNWLGIIWTNLGGYFKNNPLKAILAYYYGLYISTLIIDEMFPLKRNSFDALHTPIDLIIHTKVPNKWVIIDTEKEQSYGNFAKFAEHDWMRINE